MDTISKRMKDAVRSAMQENKIYTTEDIRQLIYDETGMKYKVEYKETHFAGCLSALKKSGEIIQMDRGEYRRGNMKVRRWSGSLMKQETEASSEMTAGGEVPISQVKEEIMRSVQRELAFLRPLTKRIVLPFDTPEEDIQYMLKVKELVKNLEEFEQQMEG